MVVVVPRVKTRLVGCALGVRHGPELAPTLTLSRLRPCELALARLKPQRKYTSAPLARFMPDMVAVRDTVVGEAKVKVLVPVGKLEAATSPEGTAVQVLPLVE
jgi:hypothetical protein